MDADRTATVLIAEPSITAKRHEGSRKAVMRAVISAADEWMRKLIEAPQEFDEQLHDVTQSLKDQGEEPSYGRAGVAILTRCLHDARRRMN